MTVTLTDTHTNSQLTFENVIALFTSPSEFSLYVDMNDNEPHRYTVDKFRFEIYQVTRC